MSAHWSQGFMIGLPIACLAVALVVGFYAFMVWLAFRD